MVSKNKNKSFFLYESPFGVIAIVSLSIFIAETVSMFVIYSLPPFSSQMTETLLDSSLLLILLTPTLYFFLLRPMLLNITERKRAQDEINKLNKDLFERNEQLEFANKELEAFIYSVSHDLRAPLRHISGFADLVIKGTADKLDEKGKRYLSVIHDSAEKMSRLIDDLLNLSRISRQEIQRREVDVSAIAASIIAGLREAHPGRNVEMDIKGGLTAYADPGLVEVVLSNLLRNAWKFTSKTQQPLVEFGTVEQDNKIIYYVRDNGDGFDQQYAGKMFLPFHRLHSETAFEGTGIGLAIVARIILLHGGKVWAEGKEGTGATIYFSLS